MESLKFFIPTSYAPYAIERIKSIAKLNNCGLTTDLRDADVVFASHFKGSVKGTADFNKLEAEKLYNRIDHNTQYINWIYGLECLDSKQCNYQLMKKLYEKNGCSIHRSLLEITPVQYDLTNRVQCLQFKDSTGSNRYLAKGAESQMGEDIYVIEHKDVDCQSNTLQVDGKSLSISDKKFQAQRLVMPLLLDGEATTFRVYILIFYVRKYGFVCYYYHPGYAYSSGRKFKKGDFSIENLLSNRGIRRGWEADQIDKELIKQNKIKVGESFMNPVNKNSFCKKVKKILNVVMKSVLSKFKRDSKVFALLGCDILVDDQLNCFWIDPNISSRMGPWTQPQWESAINLVIGTNDKKIVPVVGKYASVKQSSFSQKNNVIHPTGNWLCIFIEKKTHQTISCKLIKPTKRNTTRRLRISRAVDTM